MIYGLDDNDKFYVEYTACPEPIGTVRQEMEKSCIRLASEAQSKVLISLTSGLDSQVLLHTFHTLGLPYECAFMYHPGYNDFEYNNIKILEKKYGFKCTIVEIDPFAIREEIEASAIATGIPAEHHMMKKFLAQLPEDQDFCQGIESFDFVFRQGRAYCMESWTAIEVASQRALKQVSRSGKIVCIDRRAPFNNFALAYLSDPVVTGYINGLEYIRGNGLVDKETGEPPPLIFSWEYYVKPIIYGIHWGKELEIFPKYVSSEKVDFIMNPVDSRLRHNYKNKCVFVPRDELITHLSNWGSDKVKRFTQI
jgi:hypothetical protein